MNNNTQSSRIEAKLDTIIIQMKVDPSHIGPRAESKKIGFRSNSLKQIGAIKESSIGEVPSSKRELRTDGKYDVFVSHGKKLTESEDRAVWVADVCEASGILPFFDRSDLLEITEPALKEALLASDVLVTVIDPFTFNSIWVLRENVFAFNLGVPIVVSKDGS